MRVARNLALSATTAVLLGGCAAGEQSVDLSPETWGADYRTFLDAQAVDRSEAGYAEGEHGAVTVAYNGLAARAGLEALRQGGSAVDAAMTAALTQVTLTAGAPISYFGILSLVTYDAATGEVQTMNAEWNTVRGETEPLGIPGRLDMSSEEGLRGYGEPSGRTALVGGFMKGVEAAHRRFGKLPWAELFEPAIHIAEHGFPISEKMAGYWELRADDLARLPETAATLLKEDGSPYVAGDTFRQPRLAATLRRIAEQGADYMYRGPWAERLVAAVQADGGKMTLEDLAAYEVLWQEPLVAEIGGYRIFTNPPPNNGGVGLIEAQQLAIASGLVDDRHWSESGPALRKALEVTQMLFLGFLPEALEAQLYPGLDLSPEARVTPEHARELWRRMQTGARPFRFRVPASNHSDDVVAIDRDGNIVALTQSINCVLWGKTAIVVDGITIGDPASFQQMQIAQLEPGSRLPSPTETGILFRGGEPVLAFASMGAGLHQRTFQGLLNVTRFGMSVREAVDAPDFFMPRVDPTTGALTVVVPEGRFPKQVLESMGYAYEEVDPAAARFAGEGLWVAIGRDPETGWLEAASHNRNNSAAVAF